MIGPIILQVVLIFLNATFASAEIAVISFNDAKLKKLSAEGNTKATRLVKLTEQPARFLATIQVAITLAGLLGSAYAADNFAEPLVKWLINIGIPISENILNSVSVLVITLILSYFSLVFGELVPKRIAMNKVEETALGMSGVLFFVAKAFAPLVWLLTASTNGMLRLIGIDPNENNEVVTEEEIRMLIMEGNEQGTIRAEESEIIQNVFEFNDTDVEEICTHRRDVIMLYLEDGNEVWEETISGTRHTFYPICDENKDDIVGILNARDYFIIKNKDKDSILEKAVEKAYFIPETMKADVLFHKMKETRNYFAIILDEYGTMSGIITLHDLIEALVGDINDIEDEERPEDIEQLEENSWRIQGYANLEDVEKTIGVSLPTDTYDTYSGFICGIIGHVPEERTAFECEYENLKIQIINVENHVITETVTKKLVK